MNTNHEMNPARRDAMRQLLVEEVQRSADPLETRGLNGRNANRTPAAEINETRGMRKRFPRRAFMLAAAAVLVGGVAATGTMGFPGTAGVESAAAAEVLENAAIKTIQTADPLVTAGQYLKVSTTLVSTFETYGPDGNMVFAQAKEGMDTYVPGDPNAEWVLARPRTELINAYGISAEFFTSMQNDFDVDGEVVRAKNAEFYGADKAGPKDEPTAQYLASLPRDPKDLLKAIRAHTKGQGQSADGQVLVFVADLLNSHRVPAELRASLYRAVALVPTIDVVERQATIDGRVGVSVGYLEKSSGVRSELIIDTTTGTLIGERNVVAEADSDFPVGTIYGWSTTRATVTETAP
jgi:hypothetical protein